MIHDTIFRTLTGLVNICFFRATPAVLPYSKILLVSLIIIEFAQQTFNLSQVPNVKLPLVILATLSYLFLFLGFIYIWFKRFNLLNRMHKALIALLGTELLLMAALQLIIGVLAIFSQTMEEDPLLSLLVLGYLIWIVLIRSNILKHALEIKMLYAFILTIAIYMVCSLPIMLILSNQLPVQGT